MKYLENFINFTHIPHGQDIAHPIRIDKMVDFSKEFLPKHKVEKEKEISPEIYNYFRGFKEKMDEETIRAIIDKKWKIIPSKELLTDIIILLDSKK